MTTRPDPELVRAADAALTRVVEDWLARPGVISVEVARRWRDGAATDDIGIRVTVERVLPPEDVPDGELFPSSLQGFPVDVVEGRPPQPERP